MPGPDARIDATASRQVFYVTQLPCKKCEGSATLPQGKETNTSRQRRHTRFLTFKPFHKEKTARCSTYLSPPTVLLHLPVAPSLPREMRFGCGDEGAPSGLSRGTNALCGMDHSFISMRVQHTCTARNPSLKQARPGAVLEGEKRGWSTGRGVCA